MFYKKINGGKITGIGMTAIIGGDDIAISEQEYNELLSVIQSRPVPPEGYEYVLTTSLEWQLVEVPPVDEDENEAEEADFINALNRMGVET